MEVGNERTRKVGAKRLAWWFPAGIAALATLAVAAWTLRQDFRYERAQAVSRLDSISELRATQVRAWVARQMNLAYYLDDSKALADLYTGWQEHADVEAGSLLLTRMSQFRQANDGDSALLTDAEGNVLAREHPADGPVADELRATVKSAIALGHSTNSGIYRREGRPIPIRMDVVIPLLRTGPPARGAVVLRVDPNRSLFPTLASWPVPSTSADSVLWERQGENVVNVSDGRFAPASPQRYSEPVATSAWPIARVLRGDARAGQDVEGLDYRGVKVLAVVRPVDGTNWWIVSKMDVDEVYGPTRRNARWTIVAAALALLGIALASRVQRQHSIIARAQLERSVQMERLGNLGLVEGIAQSASDLIFAMDRDGRYVFCNKAASQALGKPVDQIVGHTNAELFDAYTAEVLDQHDREALLSTTPKVYEESLPSPNGMLVVMCTKGPMFDSSGALIGIYGVSRDVRDMRRAERALRDSEAQYRSVVTVLSEAILVCNPQGEVVASNPAADRIFGGGKPQWRQGTRPQNAWTPLRADGSPMPAAETPTGIVLAGGPAQADVLLVSVSPEGRRMQFAVSAAPVIDQESGELLSVVTSVVDVSERKRLEDDLARYRDKLEGLVAMRTKALQDANEELERSRDEAHTATRAKSAFLANMSHEIRTPMNAIIGLAHLMTRDTRDAVQHDRLVKVTNAAQHLLQVINDILDLSKIEAGKLVLEDVEFSTETVMSRVVEMVGTRSREKGLELVLDTDHLPRRLRGDSTRLSQVMLNLLSNAAKFTEHGWIRLRASVAQEDVDSLLVRFEVQDTGPGISAERQAALFSTFEQADNSSTRLHGGTGLGLALSRQLARSMGGDAGVQSALGEGSTFWFTVRLGRGAEAVAQQPILTTRGLRALVVDDLPEALSVIGERLKTIGFEVELVDSGRQAIRAVEQRMAAGQPFDVMLIDWRMTPMDGIETLRELRKVLADGMPPSVLITAFDDPEMYSQANEVGYDGVLLKPVTNSSLHDTLTTVLARHGGTVFPVVPERTSPAEELLRTRHEGQRVLLAEDNPINREVAEELLSAVGLVVETAWNGARAVELALSRSYDVVLMDIQMPIMDGLEATDAIRRSAGRSLPIIAMTANAFTEDREVCLKAGMNDHIPKPVDPSVMYSTLLRWLPLRQSAKPSAAQAVSEAATSGEKRPLAERLAEIEGFDVAMALRNVGGQVNALARILRRFVDAYGAGLPVLLDLSGDEDEGVLKWRAACHSVRGALSTLGAVSLVEHIQALERDLGAQGAAASRRAFADQGRQIHEGLLALVARVDAEISA